MRTWIAALGVFLASSAQASEYVQIVNVAACPSVSGGLPNNLYSLNNWIGGNGVGALWSSGNTVVLFCDLRLPAEATGFDYLELEYGWQAYQNNPGPSVAAYLEQRAVGVDGTAYNVTQELGECFGNTQVNVNSDCWLCQVSATVSFLAPDGGPTSSVPPTLYALIFLPPLNDYSSDQVYRLIVHYEAP